MDARGRGRDWRRPGLDAGGGGVEELEGGNVEGILRALGGGGGGRGRQRRAKGETRERGGAALRNIRRARAIGTGSFLQPVLNFNI